MLPYTYSVLPLSLFGKKCIQHSPCVHLLISNNTRYRNFSSLKVKVENVSYEQNLTGGPIEALESLIQAGDLKEDEHQKIIVQELERVYIDVQNYTPPKRTFFSKLFNQKQEVMSPKGLYLYGAVGGGKTMLMDLFYGCCKINQKKRVHFNAFMLDVHARIHQLKKSFVRDSSSSKPQPFDVIRPLVEDISNESWLICFDEFQSSVEPLTLFEEYETAHIQRMIKLFSCGIVVIATSNRPPDDLYKNGLQRSNFVPFIQVLKNYCKVVSLDSGIDYRTQAAEGRDKIYFVKDDDGKADLEMDRIFKVLCSMENDIIRPRTLTIMGRNVTFRRTCGQVMDTTFSELCCRALGASDYLQLSQAFHTVLIRDVPQLSLRLRSETRRFITLIDTFYDNRVRLVISAERPHKELFLRETSEEDDDSRVLMDDLNIDKGSENASSNIFTGDEEIFAFDRTISRLSEMQTEEYWKQWNRRR